MQGWKKGGNPAWWILKGLGIVILVAALVSLLGLAVMGLWNAVVPSVFGLKPLDWPLALGLLVLARLLFGFPGRGGRGHGGWRGPGRGLTNDGWDGWQGRADKWKHYRDFWKDEGQAAFEGYLKRKEPPTSV